MARGRTLSLKVETEVKGLDKLNNLGKKLQNVGRDLTVNYTLPIAAAGVAAVKFASDLEEASSKAATVFTTEGDRIAKAAQNLDDAFSEATFLDTAGTFGALLQAMGLTEKAAADLSLEWLELSQDMASFHNTKPDEALQAIRSALAGEFEPLKRYGVMLNAALLEQRALESGLWDGVGALDAQTKALVINQELLRQQPKVVGDYARTADGVANSTRRLTANLEDAAASLGKELLPFAAEFLETINGWVTAFADLDPEVKTWIVRIAAVTAAVGPVLLIVGKLLTALKTIRTVAPLAWAAMSGPLGLLVIGIGAVGAVLDDVGKKIDPAGVALKDFADRIGPENWDRFSAGAERAGDDIDTFAAKVSAAMDEGLDFEPALRRASGDLEQFESDFKGWGDRSVRTVADAADRMAEETGAIPGKMADELLAEQFRLTDATAQLVAFMEQAITPAQEMMQLQGFLASNELARGLASNNPLIRQKSQEMRDSALSRLAELQGQSFDYGYGVGTSFAAGMVAAYGWVRDAAGGLAAATRNQIGIESEPRDPSSPLHGITKWGANIARTLAEGMDAGIGTVTSASQRLAGAVVQPAVATPRPQRAAGVLGGIVGGTVTNVFNLTFTGQAPDARNEREIVAALQRLAPFIDGKLAPGY